MMTAPKRDAAADPALDVETQPTRSNQTPLVSIVTPCYNGEGHVGRLIKSVLDQTYPNIEFILVNDGSTDATSDVVASFKEQIESRLSKYVYLTQDNAGAAAAISAGLQYVTGQYLCWPDADDYLEPDSVGERVRVLMERPEYAVVTSDARIRHEYSIDVVVGTVSSRFPHNSDEWQFEHLLRGRSIFGSGCHMARMLDFDETHPGRVIYPSRGGQNWQMLLPLYYRYKRYFLDVPLFNIVVRESSHSRGDDNIAKRLKRASDHRELRHRSLDPIPMSTGARRAWDRKIEVIYLQTLLRIGVSAGVRLTGLHVFVKKLRRAKPGRRDSL